jgi:hypothetical protein
VVVLRCTRKLLRRMGLTPIDDTAPCTNVLGAWYANLIYVGHVQLILATNERSLGSTVVVARDAVHLGDRLTEAVEKLLLGIGIQKDRVTSKLLEMQEVQIGRTASRTVLGMMNDFQRATEWILSEHPRKSLESLSLELSRTPCSPLGGRYPEDVARELFAQHRAT